MISKQNNITIHIFLSLEYNKILSDPIARLIIETININKYI